MSSKHAVVLVVLRGELRHPAGPRAVEDQHGVVAGILELLDGGERIGHAAHALGGLGVGEEDDGGLGHEGPLEFDDAVTEFDPNSASDDS